MNPLELFLNRVARELRSMPSAKRDEELRELRSHLEQRAEDFEAQGLEAKDAQSQTVEAFGSPRVLGSKLCDAWEGIPSSWWRVAGAVLGVTMIWLVGNLCLHTWLTSLRSWPESVLFPELGWFPTLAYGSLPSGCGAILSFRLGRRGWWIGLVYFSLMSLMFQLATSNIANSVYILTGLHLSLGASNSLSTLIYISIGMMGVPYPVPLWSTALGMAGTLIAHRRRTQRLLATSSGVSFSFLSPQRLPLKFNKRLLVFALVLSLVFAVAVWTRIRLVTHPLTPSQAFRNLLLLEPDDPCFDHSILALRELPAQTPAERAGRERRLWFRVQIRLAPWFIEEQLPHWQRENKRCHTPQTRRKLAQVQANSHIEEGVARVVKTSKGWQMDKKSFDHSKWWSWYQFELAPYCTP